MPYAAPMLDEAARTLGVTTANWLDPPFNRYGFRHVPDLVRTAPIGRGDGPVRELPRAERDLGGVTFRFDGATLTVDEMLAATFTDGFLVLHDGAVVDRALPRRDGADRHAPPDVGVEVADVDPLRPARGAGPADARGPRHGAPSGAGRHGLGRLPAAAPARHARRKRVGLRRRRVHDPRRLRLPDARPARDDPRGHRDLDPDDRQPAPTRTAPGRSATARSPPTCSAGRSSGSAGRPSPSSSRARSGRGSAPSRTRRSCVDHAGFAIVEGGICTTLRDLARFGQMCLDDGRGPDGEVVPAAWIGRVLQPTTS